MFNVVLDPNSDPLKFDRTFRPFVAESALRLSQLIPGYYYKVGSFRSAAEARSLSLDGLSRATEVFTAGNDASTLTAIRAELERLRVRSTPIAGVPNFAALSGRIFASYCRSKPGANAAADFCERFDIVPVFVYDLELRLSAALPKFISVIVADAGVPGAAALAHSQAAEAGQLGAADFATSNQKRTHRLHLLFGHDADILPHSVGEFGSDRDFNFLRQSPQEDALVAAAAKLISHKMAGGTIEFRYLVTPQFQSLFESLRTPLCRAADIASCFVPEDEAQFGFADGDEIIQVRNLPDGAIGVDHVRVLNDDRIFFETFPNGFATGGLGPK